MNKKLKWPEDYQNWTGTFEDLVQEAGDILVEISPDNGVPTSSLVRYYQQQGAVGRGEKLGRASLFRYEDLARVVATKQMSQQQVPLSITKEMLSHTPVDTIVRNSGIFPGGLHGSPAAATSVALSNHQNGNEAERAVAKLLASSCYASPNAAPQHHAMFASVTSTMATPEQTSHAIAGASMTLGSLPPGGVLRYTLLGGVAIEIPADCSQRKTQADALRTFADQIDPPQIPHKRSAP